MPRIPDADLERLKQTISLQRLAEARGIELKRHDADLIGCCPFHDDKTPSLVITPAKNRAKKRRNGDEETGTEETGTDLFSRVQNEETGTDLFSRVQRCVWMSILGESRKINLSPFIA